MLHIFETVYSLKHTTEVKHSQFNGKKLLFLINFRLILSDPTAFLFFEIIQCSFHLFLHLFRLYGYFKYILFSSFSYDSIRSSTNIAVGKIQSFTILHYNQWRCVLFLFSIMCYFVRTFWVAKYIMFCLTYLCIPIISSLSSHFALSLLLYCNIVSSLSFCNILICFQFQFYYFC